MPNIFDNIVPRSSFPHSRIELQDQYYLRPYSSIQASNPVRLLAPVVYVSMFQKIFQCLLSS